MPRWARPQDMAAVRALWQARFGDSDAFADFFFRERARPERTLIYEEDGRITSALQVPPVSVRIRGRAVGGAMLCGVSTAREFEGRGHMGACLRHAMRALSEAGCAIIVQKPVDFRIYQRFSFVPVSDTRQFSVPHDPCVDAVGTLIPADAGLLPQMRALYDDFCRPYSTCLNRSAQDFTVKLDDLLCDGGEGWGLNDADGTLIAYAFCEADGDFLRLREGAWRGSDAMARLFALLRRRAASLGLGFSGRIPPDQQAPFADAPTPFGAAAVGNTAALLRTVFDDDEFCAAVSGNAAEENNGVFDLAGRRTDRMPDFVLDAGQLVQLACGYSSLHELAAQGAQIRDAARAEAFDRRWRKFPCFTWDEY